MELIFISYRRLESAGYGGRLQEDLGRHFGRAAIFRDVGGVRPGRPFAEVIDRAVADAGVVLVLIGRGWTDAADADGNRRLDQLDDFVRREIESALSHGVPLIPVTVDGAAVPDPRVLPASISQLGRIHGIGLTDERWDYDLGRLIAAVEEILAPPRPDDTAGPRAVPPDPPGPFPPLADSTGPARRLANDHGSARRRPFRARGRGRGRPEGRPWATATLLVPLLAVTAVAVDRARSDAPGSGGDGGSVAQPGPSTARQPGGPVTANLIQNPGAEDDSASAPFTPGPAPVGWWRGAHHPAAAAYGSSGSRSGCYVAEYPAAAEVGGSGAQLFIGGYDADGGCALPGGSVPKLVQDISLAAYGSGLEGVGWEARARLGSRASSPADGAELTIEVLGSSGRALETRATGMVSTRGPLETRVITARLPSGAVAVRVILSFRVSIAYSGGLADDVSFRLTG